MAWFFFLNPWWRWGGSNSWPPACKAGALPAELHPRILWGFGTPLFPFLFENPFRTLKIEQHASFKSSSDRINCSLEQFSLERRWSSRTFRYGYLVTTSPQSLALPSTAASFVSSQASGISNSHGVTGGVYKARERIHGSMLTCHY